MFETHEGCQKLSYVPAMIIGCATDSDSANMLFNGCSTGASQRTTSPRPFPRVKQLRNMTTEQGSFSAEQGSDQSTRSFAMTTGPFS